MMTILSVLFVVGLSAVLARSLFFVPPELRHLPRVPILPLLWSYLRAEEENKRLRRLILPFADRKEEVVLVWALGRWMVHILDHKVGAEVFSDPGEFPKEDPPDDLLLWRLIGRSNILLSNGERWRKHSRLVRTAINQTLPIAQFAVLARRLIAVIARTSDTGEPVRFDDLSQRFALDAVGTTAFGHDFDAIARESEFVRLYNGIMHGIANPLYLIMPVLERVVPRTELTRRMQQLSDSFQGVLDEKRENPGPDMLTFMLKDVNMSDRELRDNMLLLFIAGHDTSAGGITTLIYYLALHRDIQVRARQEVLQVLGEEADPTLEDLPKLRYLTACIREALRINTPISYVVPRASAATTTLGRYRIPPHTSIVLNIYAIHHSAHNWADPFRFDPDRFLVAGSQKGVAAASPSISFGLGPRQCPAQAFAVDEQLVLTAMLLRECEWVIPENSVHAKEIQNAFSPFALSLPHKVDVLVTRR